METGLNFMVKVPLMIALCTVVLPTRGTFKDSWRGAATDLISLALGFNIQPVAKGSWRAK